MKRLTVFLAMLFTAVSVWGQSVKVEGTVLDNEGYPLPHAAVFVKGGTTGVVTDFDGNYSITVPSDAVLVFSFQGYTEREEAVNGRERIDVTLTVDNLLLEESVVVGYGTQKSKDLTAPIVTIKGGELTKQAASSPMAALQGMVSGVQVINSGAPGSTPKVKVRGVGSISDYANPLYVVDGVFQDNIDFLSSNDIESLTVLKDASAAAIYGVRAANGVIIVTTKKGTKDHLSINYESYAGVQVPINIMPLANKAQYVELVKPAFTTNHSVDLSGASDYYKGYTASSPSNDTGTVAPTASLADFPYLSEHSEDAMEYFYYVLGDRLWGEYGFKDSFALKEQWFASSYIAIDQGPIVIMMENYRTALLWNLFMSDSDVRRGLDRLGFTY